MPGAEKALPVSNVSDGKFRFLWPFRHTSNQQKVRIRQWSGRKNEKYNVRSWNVYENKENMDIMPVEMSDIYVDTARIWQNIADSEGQFVSNDTFATGFPRKFAPKTQRPGAPC